MNIINKVKVNICGKEYNLQTDESAEYINALAKRLDKEIADMMKLKPNFGVQNAAVFVALTSLDEAAKSNGSIDNIRKQIKSYVDDAAKARSAKEKLAAKVKELEARVATLEKENKELRKHSSYDCEQLVLENTITPAVTIYAEENVHTDNFACDEKPEAADTAVSAENTNEANADAADKNGENASCSTQQAAQITQEQAADEKTDFTEPVCADTGTAAAEKTDDNGNAPSADNLTAQQNKNNRRRKNKH